MFQDRGRSGHIYDFAPVPTIFRLDLRLLSEMMRSCKCFRHVGNMATSRFKWVSKVVANQAD
jgi:hypothetical protein